MDDEALYGLALVRFAPDARLVAVERLTGGVSASIARLDYVDGKGAAQTVVVRCPSAAAAQNDPAPCVG